MKLGKTSIIAVVALGISQWLGACSSPQNDGGTNTNWISCEKTADCPSTDECVNDRCIRRDDATSNAPDAAASSSGGTRSSGGAAPVIDGGKGGTPGLGGSAGATNEGPCDEAPMSDFCLFSTHADGSLRAGDPMVLAASFRSERCHGSSCTRFENASCTTTPRQNGEIALEGTVCMRTVEVPGAGGCTADCVQSYDQECRPNAILVDGDFNLTLRNGKHLVFTVPSVIEDGKACAE